MTLRTNGVPWQTDEGVTWTAFLTEGDDESVAPTVGFRATMPDGSTHVVELVPSGSTGEGPGTGNVFLYDDGEAVVHVAYEGSTEDGDWWAVRDAVGNSVEVIADDATDALYFATLADTWTTANSDTWTAEKV